MSTHTSHSVRNLLSAMFLVLVTFPAVHSATGAEANRPAPSAPRYCVQLTATQPTPSSVGGPYVLRIGRTGADPRGDLIFADDFESGNTSAWDRTETAMPTGAVAFFAESSCPEGWAPLSNRGRLVVGTPNGGATGGLVGSGLSDLTAPDHSHMLSHSLVSGADTAHTHRWSILAMNEKWWSWSGANVPTMLYEWTNGIDDSGSGNYPLAAQLGTELYTSGSSPSHIHELTLAGNTSTTTQTLPFVQLLVCVKQ